MNEHPRILNIYILEYDLNLKVKQNKIILFLFLLYFFIGILMEWKRAMSEWVKDGKRPHHTHHHPISTQTAKTRYSLMIILSPYHIYTLVCSTRFCLSLSLLYIHNINTSILFACKFQPLQFWGNL